MTTTALGVSVIVSGASLCSGLLAILCVERFDIDRIRKSVLTRRWLVWLAIAAIVLTAVGGGEYAVLVLFSVLAAVAAVELRALLRVSVAGSMIAALAGRCP